MLRLVQVPPFYYQRPMDDIFDTPWYHRPRLVPCCTPRGCGPMMGYHTPLATFLQKAMDLDCIDSSADNTSCCCHQTNHTREDKKDQHVEETSPSTPETTSSACYKNDSSKDESASEVSIPLNTSSQDDDSKKFHVSLDLSTYNPENFEVKHIDNKLKICATQKIERCGTIFHREFQRSFHLPDDIDSDSLKSTLSASGVLTVEGDRKDSSVRIEQKSEDKAESADTDGSTDERPTAEDPQESHAVEGGDGMEN